MTNTPEKKKRPRKESLIAPGPFQVSTILTGGDGIPRRPKRPPEDILFGPEPAPTSVKPRRDTTRSAVGPRSAADILFDGTSSESSPVSTSVKTLRESARTAAAPRSAADILIGKSEPRSNARPGTGSETNDKIKSGSRLGQQDGPKETAPDRFNVKRRKVSTIPPEPPQVAEGLVDELVDRSISTEPSIQDDIRTAGRVLWTPPPTDAADVEQDIRDLREIAERRGFPFPVRLLDHFLDGSGTPIRVARNDALELAPIANAQATNQKRFRLSFLGEGGPKTKLIKEELLALQDGEKPAEFDDDWDRAMTGLGSLVLFELSTSLGLGDVQLNSAGDFNAWRSGDTITIIGRVKHRFEDDYNFEKDSFPENLTNRAWILQQKGTAKVYKLWGEWAQDVVVTIEIVNGELQEPRFKWIDEPAHRP